jgi:mercuric ion transport protein
MQTRLNVNEGKAMAVHDTVPIESPGTGKVRSLPAVGAAVGLGAVLASSCCVVPLLLGGVGAGAGVFGVLETLAFLRLPLIVLGGLAVAGGWWLWWRRRSQTCERETACARAPRSIAPTLVLGVATLLVAAAMAWDFIEPVLLRLLRAA